jgi:hypothetical protein
VFSRLKFADTNVFYVHVERGKKVVMLALEPGSLAFAKFAILSLLKKKGREWMLNSEPGRVLASQRL